MTVREQMDAVTVRPTDDDATLSELYREVLQPSFRPAELEAEADVVAEVRADSGAAVVAASGDGQIVGGAVAWWHTDSRVLLLSYLAVHPQRRGGGVGTRLVTTSFATWRAAWSPLLVLAEVEDPRHYRDTQYGDAAARLRFYEGHGARVLPVPYVQPALRPESGRVPHMLLMVFHVDEAALVSSGRVDGAIVVTFLDHYFRVQEGPPRADDLELARLRASCLRAGGLPLIRPSEYVRGDPDG